MEAATLAVVAVGITLAVYGSVALIVKADDVGLFLAREGRVAPVRAFGRGLVQAMPHFMQALTVVGTAAMLWVGGSIVVHGLEELGWGTLGHVIHDLAHGAGTLFPSVAGLVDWTVKATLDGAFGLGLGLALMPVATRVLVPLWTAVTGKRN